MRLVSYTRTTTCRPGDANVPADTISIQNMHIQEYARNHGWKISEKYSDRKNDPNENTAFERMLSDGMQRKFDAVIVDSIFRAGKDLWNAKEVLLQTFLYAQIGFIVVEDDFNGVARPREEAEAYFAEKYKEFRQGHIRNQVQIRNRQGILNWNDLNYGYRLSDDQTQFLIDERTAPIVRRIFEMYADGVPAGEIAKILTAESILVPKAAKGTNAKVVNPYLWTSLTINRLLDKTVYAGWWRKTIYGVSHDYTCEPIVPKDLFDRVQKIKKAYDEKQLNRKNAVHYRYAGLVCDSREGFCLHYRMIRSGLEYYAYARNQRERGKGKHVLVSDIDEEVRKSLDKARRQAFSFEKKLRYVDPDCATRTTEQIKQQFITSAMMIAEQERERVEAHKDYEAGDISEDELNKVESQSTSLIQSLEPVFLEYEEKTKRASKAYSLKNPWILLMKTWVPELPLNREVLHRYVERIELDQLTTIQVILKEEEWYLLLPKEWRDETDGEEEP